MTPPARRFFDEIEVGEEYESPGRTITEADIVLFAGVSGDFNVVHTDAELMKASAYGERIAHGLLIVSIQAGLLSRAMKPYATAGSAGLRGDEALARGTAPELIALGFSTGLGWRIERPPLVVLAFMGLDWKIVHPLRIGDTIHGVSRTAVKRGMREGGVVIEEHAVV